MKLVVPVFLAEMASVKSCKINFWVGFLCEIKFLGTNSRAKMAHPRPSIDSLTPPEVRVKESNANLVDRMKLR